MLAFIQPSLKAWLIVTEVNIGDGDLVEAKGATPVFDLPRKGLARWLLGPIIGRMRHHLALYRAKQVRALDQAAIDAGGVTGNELMRRAGTCIWEFVLAHWPQSRSISVCCGGGNNGGDGWIVATLAHMAGWEVQVIASKDPGLLKGEAAAAFEAWSAQAPSSDWILAENVDSLSGELVVDALLGTGYQGALDQTLAGLIERINAHNGPVVAVDVPSGLLADTGVAPDVCVEATFTLSFVAQKRGLFTGQAGRFTGQLVFCDLGVADTIKDLVAPDAHLMSTKALLSIPKRRADQHKGQSGRLAVIGGAQGMLGAPILAGLAALHAGAGLVSVMGQDGIGLGALACSPALMSAVLTNDAVLEAQLDGYDVFAMGPGLGQSEWALGLMAQAVALDGRWVMDADALHWISSHWQASMSHDSEYIFTPHPGEAAQLLGVEIQDVGEDRFAAAREIAKRFGAIVVLKGFGTLVAHPDSRVWVCPYGTPAMASAGMGDALTGVIASLWGQGLDAFSAAVTGVAVHALAGEAAAKGRRQITAPELIDSISHVMNVTT